MKKKNQKNILLLKICDFSIGNKKFKISYRNIIIKQNKKDTMRKNLQDKGIRRKLSIKVYKANELNSNIKHRLLIGIKTKLNNLMPILDT